MSFIVRLTPRSEKDFHKLSQSDKKRVKKALKTLENEPYSGKKLKGYLHGHYSLRIWPFRIIYFIYKKECLVIIIRIGHRKNIYRRTN